MNATRQDYIRIAALLAFACHLGCMSSPGPQDTSQEVDVPPREFWTDWSKEEKAVVLQGSVLLGVTTYGSDVWDFGGSSFNTKGEGWFDDDTTFGGADKLGHAYGTYVTTVAFANVYEAWGYDRDTADLYGALSGFGTLALIEVGDGFSKSGFSYQDLIMDATGAAFGYLRRQSPTVERFLDFRAEYWPSEAVTEGDKRDFLTDYSGFKYLLAFKLGGFDWLESTPLEYLEFHVGYYTRGFVDEDVEFYDDRERTTYLGVGINLHRVFKKAGWDTLSTLFSYYQAPYVYVSTGDNW